jgi:hypothetical protein
MFLLVKGSCRALRSGAIARWGVALPNNGYSYAGPDGTYTGATVTRESDYSRIRRWGGWGGSGQRSWGWGRRKLQGTEQWPFYGNNYNNNANSFAQATNNGFANGPVVANSNAYANDNGPNSGYGGWGCWWCSSRTTANSAAVATNNGYANGPVVANSAAYANGRH